MVKSKLTWQGSSSSSVSPSKTTCRKGHEDLLCSPLGNVFTAGLVAAAVFALAALSIGIFLVSSGQRQPPRFLRGTVTYIGLSDFDWVDPSAKYLNGHWAFRMSSGAAVLLPLLASYIVTALLDCSSRIHSTSLRWALYEERRLTFNSNPRLFSAAYQHWPNKWFVNILGALAITVTYGAMSQTFSPVAVQGYGDENEQIIGNYLGSRAGIDVNGWALTILGLSILVHVMIGVWSLFARSGLIKTWSSNVVINLRATFLPENSFDTSSACLACDLSYTTRKGTTFSRCSVSTRTPHKSDETIRQPSARHTVPSVSRITLVLWGLFAVSVVCTLIVSLIARYLPAMLDSVSAAYVDEYTRPGEMLPRYWASFGQVWFQYASVSYSDWPEWNNDYLGVIIESCFQAPLVLGLHFSELLTGVLEDEKAWRLTVESVGDDNAQGSFVHRFRVSLKNLLPDGISGEIPHWPTVTLFLFKGLLQWVFACCISVQYVVVISLLPLITLTVLLLLLASGAETLSRYRPKGVLPSTYGKLDACRDILAASLTPRSTELDLGKI